MATVTNNMLSDMTRIIVETVAPERVILFGSQGGGEADRDSDLDFLIVTDRPFTDDRSRWSEISRIRAALHRFHVPKDILLYSADEVAGLQNVTGHVVATSLERGKALYDRRRGGAYQH
jgi:predicted nucleotidyltransferase